MAEPFLSEIRIMSFNFPPKGWALCNGQLLPINQNQALFSLLGTTYGGDGRVNFGLPDLRGNVPMHMGNTHTLGEVGGTETVTITQSTMAAHTHFAQGTTQTGDAFVPTGNLLADDAIGLEYGAPAALTTLIPTDITTIGGSQAHTNQQPYLVLSFCIALQGIFPSQN